MCEHWHRQTSTTQTCSTVVCWLQTVERCRMEIGFSSNQVSPRSRRHSSCWAIIGCGENIHALRNFHLVMSLLSWQLLMINLCFGLQVYNRKFSPLRNLILTVVSKRGSSSLKLFGSIDVMIVVSSTVEWMIWFRYQYPVSWSLDPKSHGNGLLPIDITWGNIHTTLLTI